MENKSRVILSSNKHAISFPHVVLVIRVQHSGKPLRSEISLNIPAWVPLITVLNILSLCLDSPPPPNPHIYWYAPHKGTNPGASEGEILSQALDLAEGCQEPRGRDIVFWFVCSKKVHFCSLKGYPCASQRLISRASSAKLTWLHGNSQNTVMCKLAFSPQFVMQMVQKI